GSVGRSKLAPEIAPTYVGYVAWRGTAPRSSLGEEVACVLDDGLNFQLLEQSHINIYPVPNNATRSSNSLLNFVWYRNVAVGGDLDDLLTDVRGKRQRVSMSASVLQRKHI